MKICLRCKAPVENTATQCAHCGAAMPPIAPMAPPAAAAPPPVARRDEREAAPVPAPLPFPPERPANAPPVLNIARPGLAPREIAPGVIQADAGAHIVLPAILISLALPGGGQVYNRQPGKGGIFFALSGLLVAYCLALVFSDWLRAFGVFTLGVFVIAGLSTLDAALVARRLNRGEAVRRWQWF